MNNEEEKEPELSTELKDENLPQHHFSDTDLKDEWEKFIKPQKDYYSLKTIFLSKGDENIVNVFYPSEYSKSDFLKIEGDFVNHLKHKLKNFYIEINLQQEKIFVKPPENNKEKFERFAKINPLLKELDQLMGFDFS